MTRKPCRYFQENLASCLTGKIFCSPCEGAREYASYLSRKRKKKKKKSIVIDKSQPKCVIFKKKWHFSGGTLAILFSMIMILQVFFCGLASSFNKPKYAKS